MKTTVTFPTPEEATLVTVGSGTTLGTSTSRPVNILHNGVLVGSARSIDFVDDGDVTFSVTVDAETGIATVEAS